MTEEAEEKPEESKPSKREILLAKLKELCPDKNPDARPGTIISQKLDEPFESGGSTIHFLDYRMPGTKDLRKYGATGQINISEQTIKFDMEVIALYVEKLCALGKDDANKIDMIGDFEVCKEIILLFFPVL